MRFLSTNTSGRGATVAHVLWEHEDVGSNPTAPTIVCRRRPPTSHSHMGTTGSQRSTRPASSASTISVIRRARVSGRLASSMPRTKPLR